MPKTKSKKRQHSELALGLCILAIVSLFCFAILEVSIRVVGSYDQDGQFVFLGRGIEPFTFPATLIKEDIEVFADRMNQVEAGGNLSLYLVPDSILGWTNKPNGFSENGLYETNDVGIRSPLSFEELTSREIIISMYGDSFIHGDDVSFEESLGSHLQEQLGDQYGVLNYGVGGYGIDQAYLRWKTQAQVDSNIILIGFQAENCKRNVNLVRKFYFRYSSIPFSKPRFIHQEGNLELINSPTVLYTDLPNVVASFDDWEFSEYEGHYKPEDYRFNPFFISKSIAVFSSFIDFILRDTYDRATFYNPQAEEGSLCYDLLEQFYTEASQVAEQVYILHLPQKADINAQLKGKMFIYQDLFEKVNATLPMIDPTDNLIAHAQEHSIDELYVGHYSDVGGALVAQTIIETLQNG